MTTHLKWFNFFVDSQDPPSSQIAGSSATTANSSTKLGTFRRMLNAIRYCFTKRSRSKKPDWLLDKQPYRSRSKSIPSEDVPSDASTTNILCSHLSVDPSLPSHYRVCIHNTMVSIENFKCDFFLFTHGLGFDILQISVAEVNSCSSLFSVSFVKHTDWSKYSSIFDANKMRQNFWIKHSEENELNKHSNKIMQIQVISSTFHAFSSFDVCSFFVVAFMNRL